MAPNLLSCRSPGQMRAQGLIELDVYALVEEKRPWQTANLRTSRRSLDSAGSKALRNVSAYRPYEYESTYTLRVNNPFEDRSQGMNLFEDLTTYWRVL